MTTIDSKDWKTYAREAKLTGKITSDTTLNLLASLPESEKCAMAKDLADGAINEDMLVVFAQRMIEYSR